MGNDIKQPTWRWHIPEYFNIGEACTRLGHDPAYLHQIALTIDRGGDCVTTISYQQLEQLSRSFAGAVIGLGLGRQQRLMIRLPNSLQYPVSFMGTLLAGAIAVPASTQLAPEEVAYLAKDADSTILVCTHQDLDTLQDTIKSLPNLRHIIVADLPAGGLSPTLETEPGEASPAIHCWSELLAAADSLEHTCPTKADDPAYLVYTSGTTGYPKGVLHAHRALLGRQPSSEYWFDFKGHDRILHSGKLNWTYALGTAMMDPFYRGKSVVLYEGQGGPEVWPQLIARHSCTIFIGVPTVYRQILQKTDFRASDVPTLRYCMSAGEHLSDEILSHWQQRFAQCIYEAVGMSEFSYYLSHHPSRPLKPGSAGMPQPGHEIALLDQHMTEVADHHEGMLCVPLHDPGLFIEYWGLDQETAACRKDGYFMTGDYACRDEDGYIWFLGRKDEIINSMGYRISPIEIERVLKAMPGVSDCVVVGERITRDKNLVTACIQRDNSVALDASTVIAYAANHLAQYKVPKIIRFVDSFPRTSNGKVMRTELQREIDATHQD